MKITVLYDNEAPPGLLSGWGFSCLLEGEEVVLFDTGDDASKLLHNMRELRIDPQGIDKVVISHAHMDHAGGLPGIVRMNETAHVFVPPSLRHDSLRIPSERITIVGRPIEISPGVMSTGVMGSAIEEQSLVASGQRDQILVTGCAHPGLENILEAVSSFSEITGVVGGFHSFSRIDALSGMRVIVPCHCTAQKERLRGRYPDSVVECAAGTSVII
ncbi:MAG: MBL fold metallo-hydrolase [Thermoplasmata archaeon]|nr:MBL fold metallo-hydrolase [Thermoplasmata archaeon]